VLDVRDHRLTRSGISALSAVAERVIARARDA
jgi:hypothetical protein